MGNAASAGRRRRSPEIVSDERATAHTRTRTFTNTNTSTHTHAHKEKGDASGWGMGGRVAVEQRRRQQAAARQAATISSSSSSSSDDDADASCNYRVLLQRALQTNAALQAQARDMKQQVKLRVT